MTVYKVFGYLWLAAAVAVFAFFVSVGPSIKGPLDFIGLLLAWAFIMLYVTIGWFVCLFIAKCFFPPAPQRNDSLIAAIYNWAEEQNRNSNNRSK
jgi:hypothetical protein